MVRKIKVVGQNVIANLLKNFLVLSLIDDFVEEFMFERDKVYFFDTVNLLRV